MSNPLSLTYKRGNNSVPISDSKHESELDILKKKLVEISESLWLLESSVLQELSDVVTKVETTLLSEEKEILGSTNNNMEPESGHQNPKPSRNGRKWTPEETQELDDLLKSNSTIEAIAQKFERSVNSIRLRAASLILEKTGNGSSLRSALEAYNWKIKDKDIQKFKDLKTRDAKRKLLRAQKTPTI